MITTSLTYQFWRAHLNPSSPRYPQWRKIFDSDEVPLASPFPIRAKLGPEDFQPIYCLDWNQIVGTPSDKLIAFVVERFNVTPRQAAAQLEDDGVFPIRAADVLISFSPRAFL
jgi:hypothetical protein